VSIHILRRDFPLRFAEAPAFSPDSWHWTQPPGEPRRRDTAGEYVPLAFLRDGRFAIVTPIQDPQAKRHGFRGAPSPGRSEIGQGEGLVAPRRFLF
jgi:hypothetical protein